MGSLWDLQRLTDRLTKQQGQLLWTTLGKPGVQNLKKDAPKWRATGYVSPKIQVRALR